MRTILALSIALVVAMVAGIWLRESRNPSTTENSAPVSGSQQQPSQSNTHQHAPTARVPAFQVSTESLAALPPTMRPELFEGNVRRAYQVAQEIPRTLAQLPCYCHCDRGQGHKSLHSCFVDEHGANCGICINEALLAHSLEKHQKLNPEQIREQITKSFGVTTSR